MAPAVSPDPPARDAWTTPVRHEEIFVQRYHGLRAWALKIAGNATDADDLLHDAYLQFVLRRRDLSEIGNVDAYLYGMLRRLRLSKRRAALRTREQPLTAVDYDTAALSLRAADADERLATAAELRRICLFACRRKERSRSGSVLLLRFFLGFFPREIARILKCPLRGANDWLRIARRETRAHLARDAGAACTVVTLSTRNEVEDVLADLRRVIWASRRQACPRREVLARTYAAGARGTLSCGTIAHLVGCPACLTRVTALLGICGPRDRDPHDMLRQDTTWREMRDPFGIVEPASHI